MGWEVAPAEAGELPGRDVDLPGHGRRLCRKTGFPQFQRRWRDKPLSVPWDPPVSFRDPHQARQSPQKCHLLRCEPVGDSAMQRQGLLGDDRLFCISKYITSFFFFFFSPSNYVLFGIDPVPF